VSEAAPTELGSQSITHATVGGHKLGLLRAAKDGSGTHVGQKARDYK
jgi:hypothetical protein